MEKQRRKAEKEKAEKEKEAAEQVQFLNDPWRLLFHRHKKNSKNKDKNE